MKRNTAVKSATFESLVKKALDEGASVRALSQESLVECGDLGGITSEKELRGAIEAQWNLGDVPMVIWIRKAYGGMQMAEIRSSTFAANKLVAKGMVKIGCSVYSLRFTPHDDWIMRAIGTSHTYRYKIDSTVRSLGPYPVTLLSTPWLEVNQRPNVQVENAGPLLQHLHRQRSQHP